MLPIFPFMQNIGKINEREMYTAFNMSIGLMLIIPVYEKRKITEILKKYRDYQIYEIGKIIKGNGKVQLK